MNKEQELLAEYAADLFVTASRLQRAGDVTYDQARKKMSDAELGLRREAQAVDSDLATAVDFYNWLVEKDRDALWSGDERRVKRVALKDERSETWMALLRDHHEASAWPPPDFQWTEAEALGTLNAHIQFVGLRSMIIAMFDAESEQVCEWLFTYIREQSARIYSLDEQAGRLARARKHAQASEQLDALERINGARNRARVLPQLETLNILHKQAAAWEAWSDEDDETNPNCDLG